MNVAQKSPKATGLLVGTLAGALLGAMISWMLMAPVPGEERKPPRVMDYIQLIIAVFILAKQVGDLVMRRTQSHT